MANSRIISAACIAFAVVLSLLPPTAALAQTTPPPHYYQAFPVLFPRYTGMNGYEDLVMGSDLLVECDRVLYAQEQGPTLKQMRAALEEPTAARALAMVHAGLDKPIQSPRDHDKLDEQTTYPEYAGFRRTARVLAMREYVELADGRVSKAIDTMRDGLRLAYVIESETLISELVGIAIDAIVLERFAQHFDQMALSDCIRITAVAEEWIKLPSTYETVLNMEHRSLQNVMSGFRNDPARLRAMIDQMLPEGDATSESDLATIELSLFVNSNPGGIISILDQANAISDANHQAMIAEARKPAWERKPVPEINARLTMANRLANLITPSFSQSLDKFDLDRAKMHLLGTHGLIRRFRWENNRLPSSLAELKRPDITTDPFTGKPLIYKLQGAAYEVSSAGTPARPDGSGGTSGGPVFLPRLPK